MEASNKENISYRLSDGSAVKIEYYEALPSTAQLARDYARRGYPDRYVVMTERQTDTSITRSRLSVGEYDNGIFISVILRPSVFPSQAGLLSHLSALALVTGLEEHTTSALGIGCVSDVYSDGKRIGGCSVEGKLNNFSSFEYIIVNFAIKVNEKSFPTRITDIIKKVFDGENRSVGVIIAKTVIEKFFKVYSKLRSPEKYMEAYNRKFVLQDKKIKYLEEGKKHACKVTGFNKESGALIVEDRSGKQKTITSPSSVIIPHKIK